MAADLSFDGMSFDSAINEKKKTTIYQFHIEMIHLPRRKAKEKPKPINLKRKIK